MEIFANILQNFVLLKGMEKNIKIFNIWVEIMGSLGYNYGI